MLLFSFRKDDLSFRVGYPACRRSYSDITEIRADAIRVGGVVVVRIAVVVDIGKVRRGVNATQPPVRTYSKITLFIYKP